MRFAGRQRQFPLARAEGLLIEDVDSEKVVFDEERRQAHCLTALAAVIFENCDGESSVDGLARRATERLGATVTADDVDSALAQLEDRELLVTPAIRISRRDMFHRSAAVGAGAAATLIFTVDPPIARAQNDNCELQFCSRQSHCNQFSCANVPGDQSCTCIGTVNGEMQCECEE